jgi:hypothetical protein
MMKKKIVLTIEELNKIILAPVFLMKIGNFNEI